MWVNRVDFAMSVIGPLTLRQQTCCLGIDLLVPSVIQAPKLQLPIMRYELSDFEWSAIKPMLPNKPRGIPRVDDRRVLNGIFWVLRSGAPWRDLSEIYGPYTTCYNRFVRWRRAGVWDQIMEALAAADDAAAQMIETSVVRVHQHGARIAGSREQHMGRSRGGLTSKVHAVVDANGLGLHRHALMTMIAYAFLQFRRLAAAGRKKRVAGPPPQPSLPAVRQAIIDHLTRPPPIRCPHCSATIRNNTTTNLPK
jgi:transposase